MYKFGNRTFLFLIPAGNEPSGCASIHLANAARVTYPAACRGVVDCVAMVHETYVKSQAVRLGCGFSDCIAFLFPRYSGYIANVSKAPVSLKKQVLTFEYADKTLCMPVR